MSVTIQNGRVSKTEVVNTEVWNRAHERMTEAGAQLLTRPTIENLKSWRFGSDVNDVFVVNYIYDIAGTETDSPTNPRIEFLPSLDVKVTSRPVKPTVNY